MSKPLKKVSNIFYTEDAPPVVDSHIGDTWSRRISILMGRGVIISIDKLRKMYVMK
jgi:hypothetical protein